jgi:hypothetical protein
MNINQILKKASLVLFVLGVLGVLTNIAISRRNVFGVSKAQSSAHSTPSATQMNSNVNDLDTEQQDSYGRRLLAIRSYGVAGELKDLLDLWDKTEQEWGSRGGKEYGQLTLEMMQVLNSNRFKSDDDTALKLGGRYAFVALRKADSFDLETEWRLLLHLKIFSNDMRLTGSQLEERNGYVKQWLHALKRLETEKDPNFDPNDVGRLNVTPPEGVPVRLSGMSPESIKDPKLRAEYENAIKANSRKLEYFNQQYRLRQDEEFIVKHAVKYISVMYAQSPSNMAELNKLMRDANISKDVQEKIRTAIKEIAENE